MSRAAPVTWTTSPVPWIDSAASVACSRWSSSPCAKRQATSVIATALRSRPTGEKAAICRSVVEHVWPLVGDGLVRPVVHTTLPLADAATAHALMEAGDNVGKILLTIGP